MNYKVGMGLLSIIVLVGSNFAIMDSFGYFPAMCPSELNTHKGDLEINSETGTLYLTDTESTFVKVIDASGTTIKQIDTEHRISEIAVNSVTNKIYIMTASNILVLDGLTNEIISKIELGEKSKNGLWNFDIKINQNTNLIYALNPGGNFMNVVDGKTDSVVDGIQIRPSMNISPIFEIDEDDNKIYFAYANKVYSIDGLTKKILLVAEIEQIQNRDENGRVTYLTGHINMMGLDSNTNTMYVKRMAAGSSYDYTSIYSIDINTGKIHQTIDFPSSFTHAPYDFKINERTGMLYASDCDKIYMYDKNIDQFVSKVSIEYPYTSIMAINQNTGDLFVSDSKNIAHILTPDNFEKIEPETPKPKESKPEKHHAREHFFTIHNSNSESLFPSIDVLKSPKYTPMSDHFGWSLNVVKDNILVGGQQVSSEVYMLEGSTDQAYLFDGTTGDIIWDMNTIPFTRAGNGWTPGVTVASDNDAIYIGAGYDNDQGAVYVINPDTGKYIRTVPENKEKISGTIFGQMILPLGNGQILVGSPSPSKSAAYVMDSYTGKVTQHIANPEGTSRDNRFGTSADITKDGATIAISAPNQNVGEIYSGSVYLYDGTTYEKLSHIPNPDPIQRDYFGSTVKFVTDDILAIGDPGSNKVHMYDVKQEKFVRNITAPKGITSFGSSLELTPDGKSILIGATGNTGSAFLYDMKSGKLFLEILYHDASDDFGQSLAINGDDIIIGAPKDTDYHTEYSEGSVYVIRDAVKTAYNAYHSNQDSLPLRIDFEDFGLDSTQPLESEINATVQDNMITVQGHLGYTNYDTPVVLTITDSNGEIVQVDQFEIKDPRDIFYKTYKLKESLLNYGLYTVTVTYDPLQYNTNFEYEKKTITKENTKQEEEIQESKMIDKDHTQCNDDKKLIIKPSSAKSACVTQDTFSKLVARGWIAP